MNEYGGNWAAKIVEEEFGDYICPICELENKNYGL